MRRAQGIPCVRLPTFISAQQGSPPRHMTPLPLSAGPDPDLRDHPCDVSDVDPVSSQGPARPRNPVGHMWHRGLPSRPPWPLRPGWMVRHAIPPRFHRHLRCTDESGTVVRRRVGKARCGRQGLLKPTCAPGVACPALSPVGCLQDSRTLHPIHIWSALRRLVPPPLYGQPSPPHPQRRQRVVNCAVAGPRSHVRRRHAVTGGMSFVLAAGIEEQERYKKLYEKERQGREKETAARRVYACPRTIMAH